VFSISPLTLFLIMISLAMLRALRNRPAKGIAWASAACGVASIAMLFGFIWLWAFQNAIPGKIIGLSALGLYLSVLLAFAAVMRSKNPDEGRRFTAVSGIWLLMFFLLMRGFQRDYPESLWFMDVMNNLLHFLIGDRQSGEVTLSLIEAFGKTNLLVARYFLELATVGTLALAYVFYIFVGAYYDHESYLDWRHIRAPRLLPPIAIAVIITYALWNHFEQGRIESDSFHVAVHILAGVYLFVGLLVLFRGFAHAGFHRKAVLSAILIVFISNRPIELLALIGFSDNLLGVRSAGRKTKVIKSRFPRLLMHKASSTKGLFAMVLISFVLVAIFNVKINRPSRIGLARAKSIQSTPKEMKLIETDSHLFTMDIYEFPNKEGELPRRRVSFAKAERTCLRNGKRLCTADEWEAVCRGSKAMRYEFSNDGNESHHILNTRCNTLPLGVKRKGVAKSGAMDCVNEMGIRDMTGNVWEWVDNKNGGPFRTLKGSSYQYNDDYTTQCATNVLLLDVQIQKLKLPSVGFRCCADKR
jgi:Sulfatase-modifying factor enzyme 1